MPLMELLRGCGRLIRKSVIRTGRGIMLLIWGSDYDLHDYDHYEYGPDLEEYRPQIYPYSEMFTLLTIAKTSIRMCVKKLERHRIVALLEEMHLIGPATVQIIVDGQHSTDSNSLVQFLRQAGVEVKYTPDGERQLLNFILIDCDPEEAGNNLGTLQAPPGYKVIFGPRTLSRYVDKFTQARFRISSAPNVIFYYEVLWSNLWQRCWMVPTLSEILRNL